MINFFSIGTVQSFGKLNASKNLWEQRKQTGFYDSIRESDPTRASVQEQIDRMNSQAPDKELESIYAKLQLGGELTPEEKEKVRAASPEMYQKLQQLESERKQYAEDLKKCRTGEDVQRLRLNKTASSLSAIRSVEHNPYIGDNKKLEIAHYETMRNAAFDQETSDFVKSGDYAELPTDGAYNGQKEDTVKEQPDSVKAGAKMEDGEAATNPSVDHGTEPGAEETGGEGRAQSRVDQVDMSANRITARRAVEAYRRAAEPPTQAKAQTTASADRNTEERQSWRRNRT